MFRDAYRLRRCIVPVDGFFEWKAIKGQRPKQPTLIAMKNGAPFGIAGIWENWKEPTTGEWVRTLAVITTDANAQRLGLGGRNIDSKLSRPAVAKARRMMSTPPDVAFARPL
jgi:hypothetical protein